MSAQSNTDRKSDEKQIISKAKSAVLWDKLLSEPLVMLFSLVGFILCKSLKGTHTQLALLTMLKPGMGLLILYWSSGVHTGSNRLRSNLVWAGILGRLPFLFFPWVSNPWLFIFGSAIYIFFYRASNPAWIEVIKLNIPGNQRGKIYSFASALAYTEGFLITLWILPILRYDETAWKWCFPIAAIVGMISTVVQNQIVPRGLKLFERPVKKESSIKKKLLRPWQKAYRLMSQRPDFLRFQMGFFLCGFGLMMVAAVLPFYAIHSLNISLAEFATAKLLCMSIGYVVSAKFWSQKLEQLPIYEFMVYVMIGFILFATCLILAFFEISFIYVAYLVYGLAQAGSQLSWNLSGPIFSREGNSTAFSSINVLMVGIRGCIAPVVGTLMYVYFGASVVFISFICLSFAAIWVMVRGLSISKTFQ